MGPKTIGTSVARTVYRGLSCAAFSPLLVHFRSCLPSNPIDHYQFRRAVCRKQSNRYDAGTLTFLSGSRVAPFCAGGAAHLGRPLRLCMQGIPTPLERFGTDVIDSKVAAVLGDKHLHQAPQNVCIAELTERKVAFSRALRSALYTVPCTLCPLVWPLRPVLCALCPALCPDVCSVLCDLCCADAQISAYI